MKTEMMSGASTPTEPQRRLVPDVTAKMRRTRATIRSDQSASGAAKPCVRLTSQDGDTGQVEALPFRALGACDTVGNGLLLRNEEDAEPCNGHAHYRDEPKYPRPVGELDKNGTDDESKRCQRN